MIELSSFYNISIINELRVVISKIISNYNNKSFEYAFRNWQYIVVKTQLDNYFDKFDICVNFNNLVFIIEREFLDKLLLNYLIQKIAFAIFVCRISEKIVKSNEFIVIKLFFNNVVIDRFVRDIVIVEIHIIDNFEANLLIDNNVLILEDIFIDFKNRKLIIDNCENLEISIRIKAHKNSNVKRVIKARQAYIVILDKLVKISII